MNTTNTNQELTLQQHQQIQQILTNEQPHHIQHEQITNLLYPTYKHQAINIAAEQLQNFIKATEEEQHYETYLQPKEKENNMNTIKQNLETRINTKLKIQQDKNNYPYAPTEIRERSNNPTTYTLIYTQREHRPKSNSTLHKKITKYATAILKEYEKVNLTEKDNRQYMIKSYNNYQLKEYIQDFTERNGRLPKQIVPQVKERLLNQAYEYVQHLNIHKSPSPYYVIYFDSSKYLTHSLTYQNTKTKKTYFDYTEKVIKTALAYPGLTLLLIDTTSKAYHIHKTTQGYTEYQINSEFNEIVSLMHQASKTKTFNKSPLLEGKDLETYKALQAYYQDIQASRYYSADIRYKDKKEGDIIIDKSIYINCFDHFTTHPTLQDARTLAYLITNNITQPKVEHDTTTQQKLEDRIKFLRRLQLNLYANSFYSPVLKDASIKTQMDIESIQNKLDQHILEKETATYYNTIGDFSGSLSPLQTTLKQLPNPTHNYTQEYEEFYYNTQHQNQLKKSIKFYNN